uniref:Interleukin n=1 Tax=Brugia timori TaxID=42155 RepID=A0A0R3R375_9BILA
LLARQISSSFDFINISQDADSCEHLDCLDCS